MSSQTMAKQLQEFYLDWVNNYLTIETMADHNELTLEDTATLINLGRSYHEEEVSDYPLNTSESLNQTNRGNTDEN
jgi:hypothetical protein